MFSRQGLIVLLILLLQAPFVAAEDAVFELSVDKPVSKVYPKVYQSLEAARFLVVFEPNVGANLEFYAERWGDDYNRSGLSVIRSMIVCNAWYANQVANKDPKMVGQCPINITLTEKSGKTTVLFNRPSVIGADSPAQAILAEAETKIIAAIKQAVK